MPVDFNVDHAKRQIRLRSIAPLEAEDLKAALDRQLREGWWSYGTLADTRETHLASAAAGGLFRHLEAIVKQHGPCGPVAIVTRAPGGIASTQIFSFRSSEIGVRIEVFWDMPEAEAWLSANAVKEPKPPA